jgi:hypothetical protein
MCIAMKKSVLLRKTVLLSSVLLLLAGCMKMSVYKPKDPNNPETPNEPGEVTVDIPDLSVPSSFNWADVTLRIPLSGTVNASSVRVYLPALKYNKRFAYSYTFDDDTAIAYGQAFRTIRGLPVDAEKFYHVGQPFTSTTTPATSLGYTDGCGNERYFSLGISIWPVMYNQHIDDFMAPTTHEPLAYYPYLVWGDLAPILEFGGDAYLHDVPPGYDKTNVESIVEGLQEDNRVTKEKLGRDMKTLIRSDGNNMYLTAGRQDDEVYFMTSEGTTDTGASPLEITFRTATDLYKAVQFRRYVEYTPSMEELMPKIDEAAAGSEYAWLHDFSHGPDNYAYILDLFTEINRRYGKGGADNIWFATVDEIYEYEEFRRTLAVQSRVVNGALELSFSKGASTLPDDLIFHRDFSLLISGVTLPDNDNITTGKEVYGYAYARQEDGSYLLNVNCNVLLQRTAERYVGIFEKNHRGDAKEEALYFVNQLKPSLRTPLLERLN